MPGDKFHAIVAIFMLCLAVCPAVAQRDAWENLMKETSQLESDIKKMANDTTVLYNRLHEIATETSGVSRRIENVGKDIAAVADSIDSDKKIKHEIDSLTEVKDSLRIHLQHLNSTKAIQEQKRDKLQGDLSALNIFAEAKAVNEYAHDQELLMKKYSLVTDSLFQELLASADKYRDMEGYATYRLRIVNAIANKHLYDRGMKALNSPYSEKEINAIRDSLGIIFDIKQDDAKRGVFKLSGSQFNEVDTLDIMLSRYENGIKELQAIVAEVNESKKVGEYRRVRDRENCLKTIKGIIWADDENAVYIRKRYFDMIPHLNDLLNTYWQELQANPFDATRAENEIRQLMGE